MYIQVSNNYRGTEKAAIEYFEGIIKHLKNKNCKPYLRNSPKGYHILRKVENNDVFVSDYTNSKEYPGLLNDANNLTEL